MSALARFAIRRPLPILAVWLAVLIGSLFLYGAARDNLHETNLQIPGTSADSAAKLTEQQFGGSISLAILLKDPDGDNARLRREGRKLVAELQEIPGVQVLSPFSIGGDRVLREPEGEALLTVQVNRPQEQISRETFPAIERKLETVRPPVEANVSGRTPLVRALNEASLESLDRGEMIAIPILIILLLLVFRSPIAAAVPLLAGVLTVVIGTAAMGFLNDVFDLDALALNMLTMIGLALGVDYSLLMVSRFREELGNGLSVEAAVVQATARAGRTVVFAGTALSVGMLGALAIAPGNLLVSATIGVIVACILAVTTALLAIPAGLALIGGNVNSLSFSFGATTNPWVRFAERAARRPGLAVLLTLIPLGLLATPVLALDTGPPNVANLPSDNPARVSYETFERERGAGWSSPYEVVFKTKGPITTDQRLRALERYQRRVARIDGVEAVLGPAALLERARTLRALTRQLAESPQQLRRLDRGLRRALVGTGRLRDGLERAAAGSSALASGLDQASAGSDQIASNVAGAAPETERLASGVEQTGRGASQINSGTKEAKDGASELDEGAEILATRISEDLAGYTTSMIQPLNRGYADALAASRALQSLPPDVAADPGVQLAAARIQASLNNLATLTRAVGDYQGDLRGYKVIADELERGTGLLDSGLGKISNRAGELESGIGETSAGANQLATGTNQLSIGANALSAGLAQLSGEGGAQSLAAALAEAARGSNQIGRGLQRLSDGVVAVRTASDSGQSQLRREGTDPQRAGDSGFFLLAGIDGSRRQAATNAGFAVNTANGGDTARVMVIPQQGPFSSEATSIRSQLERETERTAKQLDAEAIVGGPAVLLDDFDQATTARFPWLVLTLVLVTFLVLLALFRAPVLALIAVLLNLVTVGAAAGVLILLFQFNESLVGGPGYLDAIALSGIFAIIFGLSIDYEVFLISRLVEGRALTGTTDGAIRYGLEKTATIITGAAAIMAFVFLAFAVSEVANTRQFGIGLTVAVVLDATVVRLILLPALINLFGERTWAVPPWLDRLLPRFSTH